MARASPPEFAAVVIETLRMTTSKYLAMQYIILRSQTVNKIRIKTARA